MNLGKRKGSQPDYSGAVLYQDETGKVHKIYQSAWVNKTRSGASMLSIVVKPYSEYLAKCAEYKENQKHDIEMRKQAVIDRHAKREKVRAERKAEACRAEGSDCSDRYFEIKREVDNAEDSSSQEESEVHDNPSA